jgi:hypothetical protein
MKSKPTICCKCCSETPLTALNFTTKYKDVLSTCHLVFPSCTRFFHRLWHCVLDLVWFVLFYFCYFIIIYYLVIFIISLSPLFLPGKFLFILGNQLHTWNLQWGLLHAILFVDLKAIHFIVAIFAILHYNVNIIFNSKIYHKPHRERYSVLYFYILSTKHDFWYTEDA